MELSSIRADIQQIAEAISAVLDLDVTVVDEHLMRLAGTGSHAGKVGQRVASGSSFDLVMRTRRKISIAKPRDDEICASCSLRTECLSYFTISCPIIVEDRVAGFIAMTALTESQRERLQVAEEKYLGFIEKMSELIAAKMSQEDAFREILRTSSHLEAVISSTHDGIVAAGETGIVTLVNRAAERILGLSPGAARGMKVHTLIPQLVEVLETKSGFTDREILLESGHRCICTAEPVVVEGRVIGVVASFKDIVEVRRLLAEMSSGAPGFTFDTIVGRSPALERVKAKALKAASSRSTVLIYGESGTGKELFARAIHAASPRQSQPFISVNCGAIPDLLLESELFGYEEGAFTGAKKGGKPGKFELANGGTLFLDEIGDMPLHLQVKLLRVLQDGTFERVGGRKTITADVRVVAATNRPLEEMLEKGEFRQDLYFRLNVIPLALPPLRERPEDVSILIDHFLEKYCALLGKRVTGISPEARQALMSHTWPGNVRELQNAIEYAMNMINGDVIMEEHLPHTLKEYPGCPQPLALRPLSDLERDAYTAAVEAFGTSEGGKLSIAQALGVSRATVYRKLKEYGLNK